VRLFALVVSMVAVFWLARPLAAADNAAKIFAQAQKEERAGHMTQAYLLYSQAAALEPGNQFYWMKSVAVEARAALESPPKPPNPAPTTGTGAVASPFDAMNASDRAALRQPQPPVQLRGAPGNKDFDLRADAKSLWEKVARAYALDTVFDGDYQTGPALHFHLTAADYRDALHALEAATGSFLVPISARLMLVVKDTEQKRREVEPSELVTIPVPQATTTQELTEIATAVRQLFALDHVAFDTQQNMVVLRGHNSLLEPARAVFDELLHHRPQVDIQMELVEVDLSSSLMYGVDLSPTLPITYLGTFWHSSLSIPSAVSGLLTFGGGQSLFGIAIASATAMAQLTTANTRTLVRSEVRAVDNTPATVHVGNRLPVLTSGYYGPASYSQGGTVYMPPPSFTFEDLGITMKVTPRIHGMDEVTLDLDTEFKVVTGQSLNGIPIISNRKLTTKVRLHEGESAVVAGLLTSNQARNIGGIAGVSNIPVLGELFRQTDKELQTTEVLLVIKPTLLNLPPDQFATPAIFTGSDTRPITPL
jgi:general secretion pathway protein D